MVGSKRKKKLKPVNCLMENVCLVFMINTSKNCRAMFTGSLECEQHH